MSSSVSVSVPLGRGYLRAQSAARFANGGFLVGRLQ